MFTNGRSLLWITVSGTKILQLNSISEFCALNWAELFFFVALRITLWILNLLRSPTPLEFSIWLPPFQRLSILGTNLSFQSIQSLKPIHFIWWYIVVANLWNLLRSALIHLCFNLQPEVQVSKWLSLNKSMYLIKEHWLLTLWEKMRSIVSLFSALSTSIASVLFSQLTKLV